MKTIRAFYIWLSGIPQDKLLHAMVGDVMYNVLFVIMYTFLRGSFINFVLPFGLLLILMIGKEVYDKWDESHTSELGDIYAGVVGMVKAILFILIFLWLF